MPVRLSPMDLMTYMVFDCALTDDSEVSLNWKDRFNKSVGTIIFFKLKIIKK